MEVRARVMDPQDVEIEMTITMTAQHWEKLCSDLGESWPASELTRKFRDVFYKLKRDAFVTET